jgi:hypothetical protein
MVYHWLVLDHLIRDGVPCQFSPHVPQGHKATTAAMGDPSYSQHNVRHAHFVSLINGGVPC